MRLVVAHNVVFALFCETSSFLTLVSRQYSPRPSLRQNQDEYDRISRARKGNETGNAN